MTTTRWKMTAGGLVLALGGLAAVAGVPAASCQPDHKAGPAVLVEVPVAPVTYQTPVPTTRTALQVPTDTPVAPVAPAIPAAPELPAPVATPAETAVIPLPVAVEEKKAEPKPAPKSEPKPAPKEDKVFELKIPVEDARPAATPPALEPKLTPATPPVPASDPAPILPSPPEPKPAPVRPDTSKRVPAAPALDPVRPDPTPSQPSPAPADPLLNAPPPAPTAAVAERKLKVCLQMGEDRPRFEVRDGDEVYLRVVCDKVDVKSPSDRGETMSTMRATGRVAFVTPGGEGMCEELTVIPGTGQVVVAGRVSFKYNWGKVETTVSGEKMTFRLGSTPGVTPIAAVQGVVPVTVQASHPTR
ncbi:MAG TPA: hypothetical protein VM597_07410 [Gemmataceae bacterium]|jgi:hypothetical protein|nr:hypothetical protein [Gemmataceae bacterium]